jgi:hypothetical protein
MLAQSVRLLYEGAWTGEKSGFFFGKGRNLFTFQDIAEKPPTQCLRALHQR